MYKRNSRDNSFLSEQNLKHLDSHHSESGNSLNLTDIEDDNKSVSSRISKRSGRSVLEVNDASSKVLIEKLVKDKAKYKAEVKSLKKQLNDNNMLNLNNDEFLNQQLVLVSEERDELIDQLEQLNQNEPILKEKMRREFNRKLANEKSRLQEDYNNKEVDVSKMKHEIVMLRSQIENEQSEKEQIKLSLESEIKLNQAKSNNNSSQLQEEINMVKRTMQQEKQMLQRNNQILNDEKLEEINLLKKEKEQEINQINLEHSSIVRSLEDKLLQTEKKHKFNEEKSSQNLREQKEHYEDVINQKVKEVEKMSTYYDIMIKNIEEKNESNINQLNSTFKTEKDNLILEHQNEVQAITYKFNTSITCDNQVHNDTVNSYIKKINDLKNELDLVVTEADNNIIGIKKKTNEQIKSIKENQEGLIEEAKKTVRKEQEEELSLKDKTVNELISSNTELGNKLNTLQLSLKNMEEDSLKTKEEFVFNLNKQIETYQSTLKEKDNKIISLQQAFDSHTATFNNKLRDVEKDQSNLRSANIELEKNLEISRKNVDDYMCKNQNLNSNVTHLMKQQEELHQKNMEATTQKTILEIQNKNNEEMSQKHKENLDLAERKLERKMKEIEDLNEKLNTLKIKLSEIETSNKISSSESLNYQNENIKLKDGLTKLHNQVVESTDQMKLLEEQLSTTSKEKDDLNQKFFSLEGEYAILTKNFNTVQKVCNNLKSQSEQYSEKEKLHTKVNNECESLKAIICKKDSDYNKLSQDINTLKDSHNKLLDTHSTLEQKHKELVDENNQSKDSLRINQQTIMDHNHQKIEACNKLNELQSIINNLNTENEQMKEKCKLGINSNNSLKRELDILTNSHNNINEKFKLANEKIEILSKEKQELSDNLSKSELIRSKISNNHEGNLLKYKEMNNEILAKSRKENEEQLKQKDEVIDKITTELSETKRTIFDQINLERTGLLEQFDKERDKISVEYSEARNKCLKLAKMNENLSNQLMILKEESEASKNIMVKDYENKLDLLGKEVSNLNQRIIDNKKDYTSSLEKISVLSNPEKIELERVKEEIITKDDIIEKLKVSSTNLQNKYIKIETKCQHLEQDLNKERMELDKQKEELLKKIADTENSEKAQQNLKKIRDDSISTIREKKEEITRLNDFINELQNNLNIASQEFETVKVNLDKVTKERDISNDKIRELETKNNAI